MELQAIELTTNPPRQIIAYPAAKPLEAPLAIPTKRAPNRDRTALPIIYDTEEAGLFTYYAKSRTPGYLLAIHNKIELVKEETVLQMIPVDPRSEVYRPTLTRKGKRIGLKDFKREPDFYRVHSPTGERPKTPTTPPICRKRKPSATITSQQEQPEQHPPLTETPDGHLRLHLRPDEALFANEEAADNNDREDDQQQQPPTNETDEQTSREPSPNKVPANIHITAQISGEGTTTTRQITATGNHPQMQFLKPSTPSINAGARPEFNKVPLPEDLFPDPPVPLMQAHVPPPRKQPQQPHMQPMKQHRQNFKAPPYTPRRGRTDYSHPYRARGDRGNFRHPPPRPRSNPHGSIDIDALLQDDQILNQLAQRLARVAPPPYNPTAEPVVHRPPRNERLYRADGAPGESHEEYQPENPGYTTTQWQGHYE